MLSIENKKSKRVSVTLLVFCMILLSSHLYIHREVIGFLIAQYLCWILSGIGLAFSRGMGSIKIKWLVITLHFLLTCGVGLVYVIGRIIGWISLPRQELLLIYVLYFGAIVTLDYQKKKKTFYLFGLGLSMLISISSFIEIHYLLASHSNTIKSWFVIPLLLFMMASGLMGLCFSIKLEDSRIKWLLLGMSYLLATYYNIVLLFFLRIKTAVPLLITRIIGA